MDTCLRRACPRLDGGTTKKNQRCYLVRRGNPLWSLSLSKGGCPGAADGQARGPAPTQHMGVS